MFDDLDSVLNGTETAEEVIEQETPEQGATEEVKAENTETPAEPQEKDPVKGLEKAVTAERHKRQEAERRYQELQAQLAQKEQQEQENTDPYKLEIKNEIRNELAEMVISERINISEALVKEKYSDYEEKRDMFIQMAQENPALISAMRANPNPAQFAYNEAVKQIRYAEMSDPEKYEKTLREKMRAEIEAEMKAKYEEVAKKLNIPGSLADARGAAGTKEPAYSGPTPLNELFKEY